MIRPLRVLHVMHDSRRSGVPAVVYALLTSFDRTEIMPSVFFAYDGVYADDLRRAGVEVVTLGDRTPLLWRVKRFLGIFLLPWLLRKCDIMHAHSVKMAPMALVAKLLGATVVFHLHEKADKGWLLRAIMARADRVIYCAENCAEHYAEIPVRSSQVILNAIRLPEKQTPVPTRSRSVVMFGSINANKGQDLLVKAFAALQPLDAVLYLYGTIGLSARSFVAGLREFVGTNGLKDVIRFPGPTQNAPDVFKRAYLLVHSSLNECLSISLLEAMAYGVPVVANDIAGMREIIIDGVNGFVVPVGSVESMAEKMKLLLTDVELWERISSAGLRTVAEQFDMRTRVVEFVLMYQAVAGAK